MGNAARARRVIGSVIAAGAVLIGSVGTAAAVPAPKYQITVTDDFSSGSIEFVVATVPPVVEPGTYKVSLVNDSIGPHVLIGYKIPDGWTEAQFLEALNSDAPPPDGAFEVGDVFSKPGQVHQKKVELTTEGTYGYFCPIPTPAGVPHFNLGFVGTFEVAG
jgi:plastocyanin